MREIILSFPKQFEIGFKAAKEIKVLGDFKKLLICGMGGSALPGEVLKIWLKEKEIKLPVEIHRNYNLPFNVDKKTLTIIISYSGNTEETLSAFKKAGREKLKLVAITSGGNLLKICKRSKVPLVVVPKSYPPRLALGFLFSSLMRVLKNSKIIRDISREILSLESKIKLKKLEKEGKNLAKKLKQKIPLIYAPEKICVLAKIWKINFNETSKVPSFYNCFPELNHNEIAGFESLGKNFHIILFIDKSQNPKILKREILTAKILKEKAVKSSFVFLKGKEVLPKIFSNVILGNWVSYYLALEHKKDPLEEKLIAEFKKKMKV